MDLNNLNDIEQFQRLFVTPLVDRVAAEVKSVVDPLIRQQAVDDAARADHEQRIGALEGNMKKALTVWTSVVSAATFLVHYGWAKVQQKFFPGA